MGGICRETEAIFGRADRGVLKPAEVGVSVAELTLDKTMQPDVMAKKIWSPRDAVRWWNTSAEATKSVSGARVLNRIQQFSEGIHCEIILSRVKWDQRCHALRSEAAKAAL